MLFNDQISANNLPLDFVKSYLRIDHDLDDLEIELYIRAAKSYVRNYVKLDPTEELSEELVIPILVLVAKFYESKTTTIRSTEKLDFIFAGLLDMNRGNIV